MYDLPFTRRVGRATAAVMVALVGTLGADMPAGGQEVPGSIVWSTAVEGRSVALIMPLPGAPVRIGERSVEGYDADTGTVRWTMPREGDAALHLSGEAGTGRILVRQRFDRPPPTSGRTTGRSWRLRMIDHRTGATVWDTDPVAGDCISAGIVEGRDTILLLVRDETGAGTLVARSASNGEIRWTAGYGALPDVPFGEQPETERWYATSEEVLYRIDRREPTVSVAALALADGALRWVGYLGAESAGENLVLDATAGLLLATGADLHRLNASSGAVLWTVHGRWMPIEIRAPWVLLQAGDGSRLQMVHLNTGAERWRSPPRLDSPLNAPVIWGEEGIVTGEGGGTAALWSVTDGRNTARSHGGYRPVRGAVEEIFAWAGGHVFVTVNTRGGTMLRTGVRAQVLWSVPLPGCADLADRTAPVVSAPVAGDGAGWILVAVSPAGSGPELVRYDLGTGADVERIALDPRAPLFTVDPGARRIYVCGPDGQVKAVAF